MGRSGKHCLRECPVYVCTQVCVCRARGEGVYVNVQPAVIDQLIHSGRISTGYEQDIFYLN